MKILFSFSFVLASFLMASFVNPEAKVKPGKWESLFDGKTTKGWHNYLKKDVSSAWTVENGVLTLSGKGGGDLVSDKEYENFELELEWKIAEGGNSGIFYRVHEDEKYKVPYLTGPEVQILDDERHPDAKAGKNNNRTAGSLYDMLPPSKKANPAGQWNKVRIVVKNNHAEHWTNGTKVVEYNLSGTDWANMVKDSKFATWEGFNKYAKGHIGLQDHGDVVSFRNIRIREL
ncbi:DUF1080 domain-containing protein [Cytophagaceae bacterium DM2B3-1]|uniref:DUF1080 domain-containing protein n=2 Tax=Xanthocytophaga TaxID=3078918 RepID=A0AAE3U753_9BACT|nr:MULTISPECIES: DUF1080 domain-containing protein [Xanthocytophaga]MDJ1468002.1 DUF1080 domain-containing protein [Xanthocytophaga flavus]MDJ1481247.1 DUF1080 domain-containing protein [Xanthocytophaga flavus]MDJ1495896.1 DUF1080 domain-containing protein [Xanthocytophaga flavus]MDJ1502266.1 DUF1080 domain-containing protein [Xanthocytophaga agilis]